MKFQTNEELGLFINHWGCFFCSILEKVEKSTGWTRHFTNENIVGIYVYCMKQTSLYKGNNTIKPWISAEKWENGKPSDGCFVWDTMSVYNYAAEQLETVWRCTGYRKVDKLYIPCASEEEILELGRNRYKGSHFVAGTNKICHPWKNEIEFDPIEDGSQCAKTGFIKSKRILTVEVA